MTTRGVVTIAYGDAAQGAAERLLASVAEHTDLAAEIITADVVPDRGDRPGRWAKINLDHVSPYDDTLYLDADTLVLSADVMRGFELLDAGWDLVITPSRGDWLGHIDEEERDATRGELGFRALQLQAGVFWFRRGAAITRLFTAWRGEWERWQGEDQGALLRALYREPVRVALLGSEYNGGEFVEHRFGELRE